MIDTKLLKKETSRFVFFLYLFMPFLPCISTIEKSCTKGYPTWVSLLSTSLPSFASYLVNNVYFMGIWKTKRDIPMKVFCIFVLWSSQSNTHNVNPCLTLIFFSLLCRGIIKCSVLHWFPVNNADSQQLYICTWILENTISNGIKHILEIKKVILIRPRCFHHRHPYHLYIRISSCFFSVFH